MKGNYYFSHLAIIYIPNQEDIKTFGSFLCKDSDNRTNISILILNVTFKLNTFHINGHRKQVILRTVGVLVSLVNLVFRDVFVFFFSFDLGHCY